MLLVTIAHAQRSLVQFCGHLLVSRNLAGWLAGLLGLLQCSMWSVELLLLLLVLHPGRIGGTNSVFQDLSNGRIYAASSTCGLSGPEEFTGSFPGGADGVICDASDPEKFYPPLFLSDADDPTDSASSNRTWWISEGGIEEVTITLDLDGFYYLYEVRVDFLSPRPSAALIEVSQDSGTSYHPLRWYSVDCGGDFQLPDEDPSTADVGEVICTSQYSDTPEEELLVFSPLSGQSADSSSFLSALSLTNLRVRFLRFGTNVEYYSAYDITVNGACICDGVLSFPELQDNDPLTCPCLPSPDPPFMCPPPTDGPLCRSCAPGYYLSPDTAECVSCDCHVGGTGSPNATCDPSTGQCPCRVGVGGRRCDSCPSGYIGPSEYTYTPCIKCFCNGFSSRGCGSDDGWYQAQVGNEFSAEEELEGFTSPGELSYGAGGYIQVTSEPTSPFLILSFPPSYLGDKRTAFSQGLSLTFDLPNLPEELRGSPEIVAYLEVEASTSTFDPPLILQFEVQVNATSVTTQTTKVVFSVATPTTVTVIRYFRRLRDAKDRFIRKALANIRFLRFILQFPKDSDPSQRVLRLHQSSLDFATSNVSAESAVLDPPQAVSYVEVCACPDSRTGDVCQTCSEGYTVDPSFGGEFEFCVACFCSFVSETCDPLSGVCACAGNTEGKRCEDCVEGYGRRLDFPFFFCDVCEDGYFDEAGNGSCVPCECNSEGSESLICDLMTGVCPCREGVGGAKCDVCINNSTFPRCDACDECTDQWLERITPLRENVLETYTTIGGLNLTNQTRDADIPGLNQLLQLVRDIENSLESSQVELLGSNVESTHGAVCELLNITRALLQRAQTLDEQLSSAQNVSETILFGLEEVTFTLAELMEELANISSFFEVLDVPNNSSQLLALARKSLDSADVAEEVVNVNFTSSLREVRVALETFDLLDVTTVRERNEQLLMFVDDIQNRLDRLRQFVDSASMRLCGGPRNATCEECGGVGCGGVCGCGDTCNSTNGTTCDGDDSGLSLLALSALNTSQRALEIANALLPEFQMRLNELRDVVQRSQDAVGESLQVGGAAGEILRVAEGLRVVLEVLVLEVELELNVSRLDPDEIGRNINATLILELDASLEQFRETLVLINVTIDMFFGGRNTSEVDLIRRARNALRRAERARSLAGEVIANSLSLQNLLDQLFQQLSAAGNVANTASSLLNEAEGGLGVAEMILDASRNQQTSSDSTLQELATRLAGLRLLIQQNRVDLEVARNLTTVATEVADQAEMEGDETEVTAEALIDAIITREEQSEQDLAAARDLQNRTCLLQTTTQDQLLQVENFRRIQQFIMTEQQVIRDDIERAANEIESLDTEIRGHISRNTACLDVGVVRKRRKRKSTRYNTFR